MHTIEVLVLATSTRNLRHVHSALGFTLDGQLKVTSMNMRKQLASPHEHLLSTSKCEQNRAISVHTTTTTCSTYPYFRIWIALQSV